MNASHKRKLAAGAVAAILVAGGGGALAARQLGGSSDTQAVVNDAAKQLGVSPTALSSALKKAYENRVDAAVAAGRLSKTEGDALKARIEANALPPLFFGGRHDGDRHFGFHHGGMRDDLAAAASYLGLTETKLASELQAGKTLAKVAADQGKTADGLVQALVDARTKELDAAVRAGRLTKADEQMLLSGLKQRITDFVNGTRPPFSHDGPPADRGFFHPPAL